MPLQYIDSWTISRIERRWYGEMERVGTSKLNCEPKHKVILAVAIVQRRENVELREWSAKRTTVFYGPSLRTGLPKGSDRVKR